ncbi:uncharacterized protein EI90DRAFT_3290006 [Cantharellus anzutake]|uniref:uncharacterized protein n=1 Tax=Cantharellus anzutake TaxID=1750568 RepID=UPI001902EB9C|nr:uncharacterized protein EI90DRAFT_3290006 [Cantharellus anzutake]KAF8329731.1 hypothetical protein EI90DRAFT_3290006 [Cantharellus anzutake]
MSGRPQPTHHRQSNRAHPYPLPWAASSTTQAQPPPFGSQLFPDPLLPQGALDLPPLVTSPPDPLPSLSAFSSPELALEFSAKPKTARPRASRSSGTPSPTTSRDHGTGRKANQPKSGRKQFSACGACQLRQVRCDLKDKLATDGEGASCTACSERGVNCVNVYPTDSKPKAQRRGRRLRVVEEVYGKSNNIPTHPGENGSLDGPLSTSLGSVGDSIAGPNRTAKNVIVTSPVGTGKSRGQQQSCIPSMRPEFLESPFYRSFHTQRPIVDPVEFRARYMSAAQGRPNELGPIGSLISSMYVIWAASYGIDESGREEVSNGAGAGNSFPPSISRDRGSGPSSGNFQAVEDNLAAVRRRRARVNIMVAEVLEKIDELALLRKPSWDGVRVLMLIMPLTEDALNPVDRLSTYQATISQIYTLCTLGTANHGGPMDRLVTARIFWYAYVHEGITSGLRGRKLIFDDDDLKIFESQLPRMRNEGNNLALTSRPIPDHFIFRLSTAPIRLSTACRQINYALTGPKASLRQDIDEQKLQAAWETLAGTWDEFENLRELAGGPRPSSTSTVMQSSDMDRFISGWQIFLFECYNVIVEAIKERWIKHGQTRSEARIENLDDPNERPFTSNVKRLLELAETHCHNLHQHVMKIIHNQLESPTFFQFDASLVRDGTFYAGSWACQEGGSEKDVEACISALQKMRWAFSAGETRIETLRYAWENRPRSPRPIGHSTRPRSPSDGVIPQLRDPRIMVELHLPISPNAFSDQGRDPFEYYVYERSNAQPEHRPSAPVPSPQRGLSRSESTAEHSALSGLYRLPPLNSASLRIHPPDDMIASAAAPWAAPLSHDPSPPPKMSRRSSIGAVHDSPTGSSHASSYDRSNPQSMPPITPDQPNPPFYLPHQQSFNRPNPHSYAADPEGVWPPLDRSNSTRHSDSFSTHMNHSPQASFHGHGSGQPYGSHTLQPLGYSHNITTSGVTPDQSRHAHIHGNGIPAANSDDAWFQTAGQSSVRHDIPQDGEDGEMVYVQEAQHLNRTRYPVEFTGDPDSGPQPPQPTQPGSHIQGWQ